LKTAQNSAQVNPTDPLATESRILVVDDEDAILKLNCHILEAENYKTVTASDGDIALSRIAKDSNFDLVILDIMMPTVSGIEVLKNIRNKYNLFELPVLFCSALSDSMDVAKGLNQGANDYIVKPVNKIELLARVRGLIFLKHMNDIALANERMATFRASHDDLTGLPNRSFLYNILQDQIIRAHASDTEIALIMVDINRFRNINTLLGFVAGDMCLQEISQRMLEFISEDDIVIRLHSNTFALIKMNIKKNGHEKKDIADFASELLNVINISVVIQQKKVHLNCRVGVALFPDHAKLTDNLMHCAESALFQAKNNTSDPIVFYKKSFHKLQGAGVKLEHKLDDALENGDFVLHYQPQMDIESQEIVGVEALVRLYDPKKGIILPSKFIPIAEETGTIVPLTKWIIKETCIQNKKWQDMGFPPMRVGVNISARVLNSKNFVGFIKRILAESQLEARYLEIEITESTIMPNDKKGIRILKRIKDMGIGISIDDFGTGYSSLNYLKELPITTLKIDRSFISPDISIDGPTGAIVKTVIKLGHSLGLNVIAEGVESEKQLAYLKENYCNEIQGFYYSKPVAAEEMTNKLSSLHMEY